jgi:Restriction endonuclease
MKVIRPGTSLEKVVERLENALGGHQSLVVKSPDHLSGKNGHLREVDVSVRGRLGATDILVVLECRDHRRRQSVAWLEQLASKRDEVRADRIIAVSTSGYTRGARDYAAQHQILLRNVEEVSSSNFTEWLTLDGVHLAEGNLLIEKIDLVFSATSELESLVALRQSYPSVTADTPIFKRASDGALFSANQLFWANPNQPTLREGLEPGQVRQSRIELSLTDAGVEYSVQTGDTSSIVRALRLEGPYSYTTRFCPIERFIEYSQDGGIVVQVAEVMIDIEGRSVMFSIGSHLEGPCRRFTVSSEGQDEMSAVVDMTLEFVSDPESLRAFGSRHSCAGHDFRSGVTVIE